MMVAAVVGALRHGSASKLTAPNHQRIVEQPALFQVSPARRSPGPFPCSYVKPPFKSPC